MANVLANLARMYTSTVGTGTLTLTTAVVSDALGRFNTFADAGITDGQTVTYAIEDTSGREIGQGVYTSATKTLTRATVYSSTNGGAKLNLSGGAQVFVTGAKADFDPIKNPYSYGAVGDGSADDSAAFTAAKADSPTVIYNPPGQFLTSSLGTSSYPKRMIGSGTVIDSSGNQRGRNFSHIVAAPSSQPDSNSIETAFNGDWSGVNDITEHRVLGASTAGAPAAGYVDQRNTDAHYTYVYTNSGHNESTSAADGRTAICGYHTDIYHHGGGDLVAYTATAFGDSTRAGSTDVLANPALVLFNGQCTAGVDGLYLNAMEVRCTGGAYDVAAAGFVANMDRTATTGAKNAFWYGMRVQSTGSGDIDAGYSLTGKAKFGLDVSNATISSAAIATKAGQYWYGGVTAGNLFPSAIGTAKLGYDGTNWAVTGGLALGNTSLKLADTDASHLLTVAPGSNLTANRTFTLTTGDAARTFDISAGDVTISAFGASLIDDAAASNARTTLGLGTAAVQNTSTSGANVALMNGTNIWSGVTNSFGYQAGSGAVLEACLDTDFSAPLACVSAQGSANPGPGFLFRRSSPSPAASDKGGVFTFQGNDDALATQTYANLGLIMSAVTAGTISGQLRVQTQVAGAFGQRVLIGNGTQFGSPTGGDKGAGTVNAQAVYDDSVLLTCPVGEFIQSGSVNTSTWDALLPDAIVPEEIAVEAFDEEVEIVEDVTVVEVTKDDEGEEVRTPKTEQQKRKVKRAVSRERVIKPATTRKRKHHTAHEFKALLDSGYDPNNAEHFFDAFRRDGALPGLPNRSNWEHGSHSIGQMTNKQTLAMELLAMALLATRKELKELKAKVK